MSGEAAEECGGPNCGVTPQIGIPYDWIIPHNAHSTCGESVQRGKMGKANCGFTLHISMTIPCHLTKLYKRATS